MGTMTRRTFVGTSVSAAGVAVLARSRIVYSDWREPAARCRSL